MGHSEAHRLNSALSWAPGGGMGSNRISLPHSYVQPGSALLAPWTAPEISAQGPLPCRLDRSPGMSEPQNFALRGPRIYWVPATHPLNPQAE